tara:strand:- start:1583 stop:1795 length:213 start_codon:yes stop_codon:yes gene_type:complete
MDDLDQILSDVALEEDNHELDWWCSDCEHGPMTEKEHKCSRCGAKSGKVYDNDSDGWEDEDVEAEVEEIW